MKTTKWMVILSVTIILSLFVVSGANAWTVGNVEGTWGMIDRGAGGSLIDLVGIVGQDQYWNGGGNLRTTDRTLVRNNNVCTPNPSGFGPFTLTGGSPNFTQWTGYGDRTYTYLGAHTTTCTAISELIISEYVETSTSRRAIEIYNGTGATVDLTHYWILIFANGSSTEQSAVIQLTGTLANGAVYIIANGAITGKTINLITTNLDFTGNDAVGLFKDYTADTDGELNGAMCDRWASGPGNAPTTISDYWWSQNPPNNDENQFRYGRDAYKNPDGSWNNTRSCADSTVDQQSGFGFDGVNGPITPTNKVPFYLGTFTHYNNQIYSTAYDTDTPANAFSYVDLMLSIPFTCNDGVTTTTFHFEPRITLDETSNSEGTCVYSDPAYPNPTPCPDKVTISQPAATGTFTCPGGTYTVNINGFTRMGLNGEACNLSFNPAAVSTEYITQEDLSNTACLWATIDAPTADIAAAKTCQNFSTQLPFYRIVVTNAGPGASRQPELTDTLPAGVDYDTTRASFLTSKLTTSGGTVTQGSCSVVSDVVTCKLLTPLPDYASDNLAKWTVEIPVKLLATGSRVNTTTVTSATADPNLANNTATATCNSTSAALISFTAQAGETGTTVMWETSEELDNVGFNLYRSESVEGERVLLNSEIIPSQVMGQNSGAVYTFVDERSQAGKVYFYWLEDVDVYGETNVYGPVPNGQVYQFSPVEEIPTVIRP